MSNSLSTGQVASLRRGLLRWFHKNARPLPWRTTRDPYRVWLSEIMLQQTQVDAVIPYYRRFIRTFPNVRALAKAPPEKVLAAWSGLGYYRRARDLHRAAQALVREHNGCFPRDWKSVRSLPGVGDYTARAILSIAFAQPYTVLDGNVARVMSRVLALRGNIHQAEFRRAIEHRANELLPRRHPGDFNQALMEIGQTICRPRQPRCPECPLQHYCRAGRLGQAESFPAPASRRPPETRNLAIGVVCRGGRVLLVKGLDEGLMPDLWNFPSAFGPSESQAWASLRHRLAALTIGPFESSPAIAELRHHITYRSIYARIYRVNAARFSFRRRLRRQLASETSHGHGEPLRWFTSDELRHGALSQLARKVTRTLLALPVPASSSLLVHRR